MRIDDLYIILTEADEKLPKEILDNVEWSQTKLTDAHVQHIIAEVAKVTGKSHKEIEDHILQNIRVFDQFKRITPHLHATIALNAIESEAFQMLQEFGVKHPDAPKLDLQTIEKLKVFIGVKYEDFYPLKSSRTHQFLKPTFKWVPSSKESDEAFQDVDTAAATRDGVFIFNKNFCQNLLEFGKIKGIKMKDSYYASQGGPIPDEYGYIEFLIAHEYLHWTQSDWDVPEHYTKLGHEISPMVANWVGDFRSNYRLVKEGLPQLPMGLFSDSINYDRQHSFGQMAKIVQSEFAKLDEVQKDVMEKILGKMADDHEHQGGEDPKKKPKLNRKIIRRAPVDVVYDFPHFKVGGVAPAKDKGLLNNIRGVDPAKIEISGRPFSDGMRVLVAKDPDPKVSMRVYQLNLVNGKIDPKLITDGVNPDGSPAKDELILVKPAPKPAASAAPTPPTSTPGVNP